MLLQQLFRGYYRNPRQSQFSPSEVPDVVCNNPSCIPGGSKLEHMVVTFICEVWSQQVVDRHPFTHRAKGFKQVLNLRWRHRAKFKNSWSCRHIFVFGNKRISQQRLVGSCQAAPQNFTVWAALSDQRCDEYAGVYYNSRDHAL